VSFEPILLAPQEEQKEIYPYRRVWRTALIEIGILLALTIIAAAVMRFLQPTIGQTQRRLIGYALAMLPPSLWLVFSYWGERRALHPRNRIITVAILAALAANAVALPLIKLLFAVDEWLPTAPGTSRIVGYAFTVGIVQEFIKYAVVRYSAWPDCIRIRSDGIAYMMAAAIGYSTVVNLDFVLGTVGDPAAVALRITETTLSQIAISTVIGYFLAELKLSPGAGILWLPFGLLVSAMLVGLSIAFRAGLVVGGVSATSTANNALQGLGMAVFLVVALFSTFYFLINNADERAELRSRTGFTS
jgi:RsiW-degrading membrane proteinase PrsW (M82 family)